MFISHKSNILQTLHDTEWECRRKVKGLTKPEYWAWLTSITTQDDDGHDVITYPSEDFTIVECTDEDVNARLNQLSDYQHSSPETGRVYNIKYYVAKRDAEEILDNEGNSHDPKQYVQSHFVGQDDTKDARLLADEWVNIRTERTRLLAETDHLALSDQTLSGDMATYRKKLRELPSDQSSKTKYSDITWPTKP